MRYDETEHSTPANVIKVEFMKALVILAGGKSRRMGTDKTFLMRNGITFLEKILAEADSLFDQIIISAGSELHTQKIQDFLTQDARYAEKIRIIRDRYENIGPMGGLMSVFEETDLHSFAVTAVDLPLADLRVQTALLDLLEGAEKDTEMLFPNAEEKRAMPLCCQSPMDTLNPAQQHIPERHLTN